MAHHHHHHHHHHHQQYYRSPFGDTTLTKVFVGGLAWETQTDVMRSYFDQFGEILEAVIITDKNTGKSKGYGFVTFREPDSARRACAEPNPVIDGRRANCNIASLGRPRPSPPPRGRNQMGNMYGGTSHGGSSLSAYPPMVAPPLQPPMPPPSPVMYPPYGYTAYPADYGYNQGIMYNQASQYYNNQQLSSSTPPFNYYGYSSLIQRAPPTLYSMNNPQLAAHHQRALQPNYLYYPQPSQFDAAQQYPFLQPRIAINPSSPATPQTSTGTEAAPATSTSPTA